MRLLSGVLTEQGHDLANWISLDRASGISADGRTIVGTGRNSQGRTEAFVATINRAVQTVLVGDVNLGGTVNFLDITPFVSMVAAGGFQAEADCDQNGAVNFLDILLFIEILIGS